MENFLITCTYEKKDDMLVNLVMLLVILGEIDIAKLACQSEM